MTLTRAHNRDTALQGTLDYQKENLKSFPGPLPPPRFSASLPISANSVKSATFEIFEIHRLLSFIFLKSAYDSEWWDRVESNSFITSD